MHNLSDKLSAGLRSLDYYLDDSRQERLLQFLDLLAKWNKAYNLTAVRDKEQMLTRHILESLTLTPYLYGSHILDVGTGAGIPGITLAIVFPEKNFYLVDSNSKKTRFLNQVKIELKLSNVFVFHERVENLDFSFQMDQILSRAFADVATTVKLLDDLWSSDTVLSLMKGPGVNEELAMLHRNIDINIIELQAPEQAEFRCLAELKHRS